MPYELAFDRFEVFHALQHAHLYEQKHKERYYGPIGRFGWKYVRSLDEPDPLRLVVADAKEWADAWPPLRAGFFGGSLERFHRVADGVALTIRQTGWH
jgi:hypothetical protein